MFTVYYGIPTLCRVDVQNATPPLLLKFRLLQEKEKADCKTDLTVKASFSDDPAIKFADFVSTEFKPIKVASFRGNILHISLTSQTGCEVEVFSAFIEQGRKV